MAVKEKDGPCSGSTIQKCRWSDQLSHDGKQQCLQSCEFTALVMRQNEPSVESHSAIMSLNLGGWGDNDFCGSFFFLQHVPMCVTFTNNFWAKTFIHSYIPTFCTIVQKFGSVRFFYFHSASKLLTILYDRTEHPLLYLWECFMCSCVHLCGRQWKRKSQTEEQRCKELII